MKLYKILEEAKKHLCDDGTSRGVKTSFVCYAVERSFGPCEYNREKARIRKWIRKQLKGHVTLEDWLKFEHNINGTSNPKKVQETRLRWLEDMIQRCKKKDI